MSIHDFVTLASIVERESYLMPIVLLLQVCLKSVWLMVFHYNLMRPFLCTWLRKRKRNNW